MARKAPRGASCAGTRCRHVPAPRRPRPVACGCVCLSRRAHGPYSHPPGCPWNAPNASTRSSSCCRTAASSAPRIPRRARSLARHVQAHLEYLRDRSTRRRLRRDTSVTDSTTESKTAPCGMPGLWFSADELVALLTMDRLLADLEPAAHRADCPFRRRLKSCSLRRAPAPRPSQTASACSRWAPAHRAAHFARSPPRCSHGATQDPPHRPQTATSRAPRVSRSASFTTATWYLDSSATSARRCDVRGGRDQQATLPQTRRT